MVLKISISLPTFAFICSLLTYSLNRLRKNKYGFSYKEYLDIVKNRNFTYYEGVKQYQRCQHIYVIIYVIWICMILASTSFIATTLFPSELNVEFINGNLETSSVSSSMIYITHITNGARDFKIELTFWSYFIIATLVLAFLFFIPLLILTLRNNSIKKWEDSFFFQYYKSKYYNPKDDQKRMLSIILFILFNLSALLMAVLSLYFGASDQLDELRGIISNRLGDSYRYTWFNIPAIVCGSLSVVFLFLSFIPHNIMYLTYMQKFEASIVDIYKDTYLTVNENLSLNPSNQPS